MNTAFKFLSRSVIVATILFATTPYAHADFLSECLTRHPGENAACGRCAEFADPIQCERATFPPSTPATGATITSFTSNKTEVLPSQSFLLKWTSTQTSRCGIEVTLNGNVVDSRDGLGSNENNGQDFNNKQEGIYTYTLTCASSLASTPRSVERSLQVKVALAKPIGTGAECTGSPEVCKLCENYPTGGLCQICTTEPDSQTCRQFIGQCQNGGATNVEQCTSPTISRLSSQAGDTDAIPPTESSSAKCALSFSGFDVTGCLISILDSTLVALAASFLQLCAYLFEFAVQISIVQFSNIISFGGTSDWLTTIWSIFRDILNIGVIFVLLYSAIQVIIGRGGEIKKIIAGVILFGVLTNFSLFLTKAAVDLSNVIALEFYQQMRTTPLSDTSFSGGLGATVVSVTGLSNLYDAQGIAAIKNQQRPLDDSILYRIAMIFVFIAVGLVFLQAAFIFISRFLSLILLLIFSPLMFAGGVFTPFQNLIKKWHKEFIDQITVAPLFMILIYIVLTILGKLVEAVNQTLKGNETDLFSFLGLILLTSALTIFGFAAALNKAKEYSGSFGGKAAQLGSTLSGWGMSKVLSGTLGTVARVPASLTARLGQQTLGKFGQSLSGNSGIIGQVGQRLANASYDVRNTRVASQIGSGVSRALSATTGLPVSVSAGAGLQSLGAQPGRTPQERADAKIENEFKRIDADVKKYQITDRKIIDQDGNKITRGAEDDEVWEKKVKIANTTSKKQAQNKKVDYLRNIKTDSRAWTEAGKAKFRAKKAAEEKLEKSQKANRDNDKRKEDLKEYTKILVDKLASDAGARLDPPLDTIILGVTKDDIEKMSKEELIAQWNIVQDKTQKIYDTYIATNKAILKDPTHPQWQTIYDKKQTIAKALKKATGARSDITSLSKQIEDYSNR